MKKVAGMGYLGQGHTPSKGSNNIFVSVASTTNPNNTLLLIDGVYTLLKDRNQFRYCRISIAVATPRNDFLMTQF
jgi:hypothetical protein